MERLSAWLHRRIFGYDGYLCARAAWRGGPFWRAWRAVFDVVMLWREPDHCEACFFRWLAGEE